MKNYLKGGGQGEKAASHLSDFLKSISTESGGGWVFVWFGLVILAAG